MLNQGTPWWMYLIMLLVIAAGVALAPRVAGLLSAFLPAA